MNANAAKVLTMNAEFETITRAEIEIWAKVERAISGKNRSSRMFGDAGRWPSEPRHGLTAFPMDNPNQP